MHTSSHWCDTACFALKISTRKIRILKTQLTNADYEYSHHAIWFKTGFNVTGKRWHELMILEGDMCFLFSSF